ncbi:MAG: exosortase/archaeosortase family protein [Ginsengibacter sp.]
MVKVVKSIKINLSKYLDINFFLRFFFVLITLYLFNVFYIAIVDKKGLIYSSFLDNNLNYILWLRNSFLYTSNALVHAMGVNSYVYLPDHLKTIRGAWVEVAYGCLGLNLMCFWVAFVIANKESVKRKISWCAAGIFSIWFINSWRLAVLLIAFEHHWKVNAYLNHETKFNIVAYSLIVFMISLYLKDSKKATEKRGMSKILIGAPDTCNSSV